MDDSSAAFKARRESTVAMRMRFGSLRSKAAGGQRRSLKRTGLTLMAGASAAAAGGGSLAGVLVWATGRVS